MKPISCPYLPSSDADADYRIENYQHPNQEPDFHDDIAMKAVLVRCLVFESILELARAVESNRQNLINLLFLSSE